MARRQKPQTNQAKLITAMSRLRAVENAWPDGYMLFAASGALMLVREADLKIIASYLIECDGGDPGIHSEDDKTYLVL